MRKRLWEARGKPGDGISGERGRPSFRKEGVVHGLQGWGVVSRLRVSSPNNSKIKGIKAARGGTGKDTFALEGQKSLRAGGVCAKPCGPKD